MQIDRTRADKLTPGDVVIFAGARHRVTHVDERTPRTGRTAPAVVVTYRAGVGRTSRVAYAPDHRVRKVAGVETTGTAGLPA